MRPWQYHKFIQTVCMFKISEQRNIANGPQLESPHHNRVIPIISPQTMALGF